MRVVSTPMKKRPSKRGSRASRARAQILGSKCIWHQDIRLDRKRLAIFGHECPRTEILDYRRLFPPLRLNFNEHMHQRNRSRSNPGYARSMCEGTRTNLDQRLLYLAGKAADRSIVEPLGNGVLFGFLEALDGAFLLQEIAGILDFGFDRLQFVAE